ncbi:hypothetical protein CcaverHIS002_0206300 [Cutaneotrichosporon cavernicola]|uniref:Uncharacterized protein n=1 Tax=Cutaneotrichosporon cavernicola TaxID=279322 RepID=A0AA48I8Y8_9TREE|nr:uncharacterized protein CcaverHIS019_0206270 [Cutaneotrichosporon cavernicola]BEI81470.1 hypothetical protein CcaverHIS002_0206300 [Cutaneotrichosporon cavernicola]BEI89265.1 hypothetical protein CcaverHIS019_0206270 [Cutaneotrichosporon cavernicola]BEI97041.1 hypothetical protein CcaverHIS631_0206300 [Cutaneotrichosporon cavernicola]BEJ04814.1 hypothetical protein CcaverHIS641_0206310 [Cutaneotrichosporon cavernicola]
MSDLDGSHDPLSPIFASAHPHIIDAILAASDRPTLLAFRGTSRAMRRAADARLFAEFLLHAWLLDIDSPSSPSVYPKSMGTIPGCWDGRGHAIITAYDTELRRLPLHLTTAVRKSSWAWSDVFGPPDSDYVVRGPRPWPRARLLHTCGLPPSHPTRLVLDGLQTLSDLSIHGGADAAIDAPTLVLCPPAPRHGGPSRMDPPTGTVEVANARTVVHILFSRFSSSCSVAVVHNPIWGVIPPQGGEIVYMFPRRMTNAAGMHDLFRLYSLLPALEAALARDARVTLVGLDSMYHWEGPDAQQNASTFINQKFLPWLSAPERITILRHDEWQPFVHPAVAWSTWPSHLKLCKMGTLDVQTRYALKRLDHPVRP